MIRKTVFIETVCLVLSPFKHFFCCYERIVYKKDACMMVQSKIRTRDPGPMNPGRGTMNQNLRNQDLGSRTRDPRLMCSYFKKKKFNFNSLNFLNCLMSKKSPRMWHIAVCIQFSVLFLKNNNFIELQNKTLKSKKSVPSKRASAKYLHIFFTHKDYWIFFWS